MRLHLCSLVKAGSQNSVKRKAVVGVELKTVAKTPPMSVKESAPNLVVNATSRIIGEVVFEAQEEAKAQSQPHKDPRVLQLLLKRL